MPEVVNAGKLTYTGYGSWPSRADQRCRQDAGKQPSKASTAGKLGV